LTSYFTASLDFILDNIQCQNVIKLNISAHKLTLKSYCKANSNCDISTSVTCSTLMLQASR